MTPLKIRILSSDLDVTLLQKDIHGHKEVVRKSYPDGHYLNLRHKDAQIIAVGDFRGDGFYADALPGFELVNIEVMKLEPPYSPEDEGRFWSIVYKRKWDGS